MFKDVIPHVTTCPYNTVMGDFNARIGNPLLNEKSVCGFEFGVRNRIGQVEALFFEHRNLYVMNTFI